MADKEKPAARPTMAELDTERRTRLNPDRDVVLNARTLLRYEGSADFVVVPMFMPGKQVGIWTAGQPVHTVPGVLLLAVNKDQPRGRAAAYTWARNLAWQIASERLRAHHATEHPDSAVDDREIGTVAHAVIHRDGTPSVFEDYPCPPDAEAGR